MATPTPDANLSFLPWARQGAAGAITTVDTLGPGQRAVADLSAGVAVNDAPALSISVRLRGPADVVGIDPNQIVRMDPRPGSSDFEPNYFPCIELDRADFPWLFTPARADANGRLRPWLCLIVVRRQDAEVSRQELLDFLRPQMASWWLPEDVAFVEALPMTATGKVHKVTLRERFKDFTAAAVS